MEQPNYCCKRVMLVEDNEIDLFVTEQLLKEVKFAEHIEVISGTDVALIELANSKALPDFIFLGLYSRYEGGYDFLNELQYLPEEVRKIKIVVLSALLMSSDKERIKQYNQVVACFQKPLTVRDVRLLH